MSCKKCGSKFYTKKDIYKSTNILIYLENDNYI